jgi:hypothetical protein
LDFIRGFRFFTAASAIVLRSVRLPRLDAALHLIQGFILVVLSQKPLDADLRLLQLS